MSILRADSIKSSSGLGAPEFPNGIVVTGIVTASILQQNASFTGVTTFSSANFTSGFNVVGVVTATDLKIGTKSAATTGKAIAMAMVFG